MLRPVEHVVVADRDATRPERHDVGAGLRFGSREGTDRVPVPHEIHHPALVVAAEPREARTRRDAVGPDAEQEASVPGSLTEALEGAEDGVDVEVRVGDREAEQPEIGEPLPGCPELRAVVMDQGAGRMLARQVPGRYVIRTRLRQQRWHQPLSGHVEAQPGTVDDGRVHVD